MNKKRGSWMWWFLFSVSISIFMGWGLSEALALPGQPVKVLFVANGNYQQETFITNHLAGFGAYTVTKMKDYQVKSTTDLSPYDLVIITGFAPNISTSGLNRIKASGKPILVVSYWNFDYAHRNGQE